jgi:hypothetical protein
MKEFIINALLFLGLKNRAQIYFDTKSKFGQAIDEYYNEMLPPYILKPIDYSTIETLFRKIQTDGFIEFRYPQNDCQYRAHAVARILLEYGIKSNKIWSFKPALVGSKEMCELTIPDPNFEGDKINWAFHVAPVVLVKFPDNKTELMVLDASVFDEPVSYKVWLDKLECKKQYYTFVHSKYVQYAVDENNVITGIWNSDAYSVDMQWISTSINRGRIFYSYIENEVFPLREEIKKADELFFCATTDEEKEKHKEEKARLTNQYQERKNIAVNSDRFDDLPMEYQSRLFEYHDRYIDGLCWENIELEFPK